MPAVDSPRSARQRAELLAVRRRQVRRRRLVAGLVIAVLVAVVAALIANSGGGGKAKSRSPDTAARVRGASTPAQARRVQGRPSDGPAVMSVLGYAPAIRKGGNRVKDIALTFDDGPARIRPESRRNCSASMRRRRSSCSAGRR